MYGPRGQERDVCWEWRFGSCQCRQPGASKPWLQLGPPRKVRGLRRAGTKVGSLGKQGSFHSILPLLSWPKSSLFRTAYPTGRLSSKPFSHSFLLGSLLMCWCGLHFHLTCDPVCDATVRLPVSLLLSSHCRAPAQQVTLRKHSQSPCQEILVELNEMGCKISIPGGC